MYILLVKGKQKWFWKVMSSNGQVVLTSQHYFSRFNARRSALKLAKSNGYELREVTDRG
jgi:uncharacterized protein YegP (UPF0339 family)